jgi:hypothetical protein
MFKKNSEQQVTAEGGALRKAVVAYLECRQAASDAAQWRDWDSVEDLEREEHDALTKLERLVGWEAPDDDPEVFWNEGEDGEDDDALSLEGSDSDTTDIDPAVVASMELVASETCPDGMVYRECGCNHSRTTNRYRLCSYHEGYAEGVEAGRQTAFAEPGTVDWSKRAPFPEGHVGVEGVDAEEVTAFFDAVGRGGATAEEGDLDDLKERLRDSGTFYADLAAENLANAERVEQLERLIVAWADDLDAEGCAEWSVYEMKLRGAVGR